MDFWNVFAALPTLDVASTNVVLKLVSLLLKFVGRLRLENHDEDFASWADTSLIVYLNVEKITSTIVPPT